MASAGSLSKGGNLPAKALDLVEGLAVGVPVGVGLELGLELGLEFRLELGLGLAWLSVSLDMGFRRYCRPHFSGLKPMGEGRRYSENLPSDLKFNR